ncbi:class I SAM-dependent methyltransferase [Sphingomonas sp. M1-B02]|uniref:class I SAM-dependent methyltransferase n=1 Tax=Sphingomonas sp. M1-B02 TaxID=3114300 RepID=UPI00224015EF|nr:methyltransferase domain-containing protein [Sphingomonas sp. S6-11]UZK66952.1 methyltransferase domain-containing protein [Sphingomonas sp. S6-11]
MPASTAAEQRTRRRRAAGVPSPWGMFIRGFFKHPVMVGAVAYSSGTLVRHMISRCDWDNTKLFVEYGPGVGTFCGPILDRLGPEAKLVAIDPNPDFIEYLKATIDDPRFFAVLGSAEDVKRIVRDHGHEQADYVVSGLPFSTLPTGVGDKIAKATKEVLRPGGAFLVYQYNPKVRNFLTPHWQHIDHKVEWWNIPPAQLWWAWKD